MADLRVFVSIIVSFIGTCSIAFLLNGGPLGTLPMAPEVPDGTKLPPAQFYEFQVVNHFDGSDQRRWKQVRLLSDKNEMHPSVYRATFIHRLADLTIADRMCHLTDLSYPHRE